MTSNPKKLIQYCLNHYSYLVKLSIKLATILFMESKGFCCNFVIPPSALLIALVLLLAVYIFLAVFEGIA